MEPIHAEMTIDKWGLKKGDKVIIITASVIKHQNVHGGAGLSGSVLCIHVESKKLVALPSSWVNIDDQSLEKLCQK